jgi:nitrate reductase (NAD(P)H)
MPDQARAEKHWWYDPRSVVIPRDCHPKPDVTYRDDRYLITSVAIILELCLRLTIDRELNVNSAIAEPDHGEMLTVSKCSESNVFYTIRGYAYGGGGRRVTRVEVSLDEGAEWSLANM